VSDAVCKVGCCSSGSGHVEKGWKRGDGGSGALEEGVGMAGGMGGRSVDVGGRVLCSQA
jgi:hypothetical protein